MAFSTAGSGALRAEINITHMIDVLLVLIIVFMVVVPMSQQKGLEAQIPQPAKDGHQSEPASTLVIQVAWAGEHNPPALKINQEEVPWAKLHDRLMEMYKQRAEHIAFVKGDDDIDFQHVAEAIQLPGTREWTKLVC